MCILNLHNFYEHLIYNIDYTMWLIIPSNKVIPVYY